MNAVSTITPCIFGTTHGFELQTLTKVPLNVTALVFAISGSEVELSEQDECVKIFRMRVKSEVFTWIGLYRKAYEIGYSREGGYYGAGLWLAGITVNAQFVVDVLRDLANQINTIAIVGGKFHIPLLEIIDDMKIPVRLMPLMESSETYVTGGLLADAKLDAYVGQQGPLKDVVDWAQNDIVAQKFRSVIIAPSDSFPRGASTRLEQYAGLSAVLRKSASHLLIIIAQRDSKIAQLEAAIQKHNQQLAELDREVIAANGHAKKNAQQAEKSSAEANKLKRKLQQYEGNDEQTWTWLDILALILIGLLIVCIACVFWLHWRDLWGWVVDSVSSWVWYK